MEKVFWNYYSQHCAFDEAHVHGIPNLEGVGEIIG